jgi:hypothetical protein
MVFVVDAHATEGQHLHQKPTRNKGKSPEFRTGTRMPTV